MAGKKEIIDHFKLPLRKLLKDADQLLEEMKLAGKTAKLRMSIDATHSGRLTNNRVYPGKHMKDSVATFITPSQRPVLRHHKDEEDAIGRVVAAKFIQLTDGPEFDFDYQNPSKGRGSGFAQLDIDIMDQDAIVKFMDGRYQEFSTRQGFDYFLCSICGNNYADDYCGHTPGEHYVIEPEDEDSGVEPGEYKCYGITGPLNYKEVSTLNVPGDAFTKINGWEMLSADNYGRDEDLLIVCDKEEGRLGNLLLVDSVGEHSVNLVASPLHAAVTVEDRKVLTGKTIVAVSPLFSDVKGNTMSDKKTDDTKVDDKTKDNDDVAKTSGNDDEPNQDKKVDDSKEGVVAPKNDTTDSTATATPSLSAEVLGESLAALTTAKKTVEAERNTLTSEVERLKGELAKKSEEIESQKTATTDALTKLKLSYASQLLDTRLILGKLDVTDVKDPDSYKAKCDEYAERTSDSLSDSLKDLQAEMIEFKEKKGITASVLTEGNPIDNPVDNTSSNKDTKGDDKDYKPRTRQDVLSEALG